MRYGRYVKIALTLADYGVLNISIILVWLFLDIPQGINATILWLVANIAFTPSALEYSAIHERRILYADRLILTALKSATLQLAVMTGLLYCLRQPPMPAVTMLTGWIFLFLLLSVWWLASQTLLKKFRRLGFNYRRTVIVGAGITGEMVARELSGDDGYGYRLMAIFDNPEIFPPEDLRRKGMLYASYDEIESFVRDNMVDTIFYTLDAEEFSQIRKLILLSEEMGADFYYVPKYNRMMSGQFHLSAVGNLPAMKHSLSPLNSKPNRWIKRALDLAVSISFLLVSPIIFIPVAIIIKLTSPGPVFFKQKRTGIYGSEFICYKFRTMKVNKESDSIQATDHDPRKTKFGDFLRRSSIDELPQFYNVLKGNMSIVGPRPHMLMHTEEYSRLIDRYMVRHSVKPGITGWAQVSGYRGGTKHLWQMEKRVEYDVWYIRHWNIFLDLKIIFLTIFNAVRGEKNAY